MANKYRKIDFRLQKELLIIVGVLFLMLILTIILSAPTKSEKFVSKWQTAGSSITSAELFEEVSAEKLEKVISSGDKVFVLFVTAQAGDDLTLFNQVLSQAEKYNVTKVYILDSADYQGDREDDPELDTKLHNLEEKFGVDLDNIPTLWLAQGNTVTQMSNKVHEKNGDYTQAVKDILVLNLPSKQ